jgi:hypothetical protein
MLTFVLLCALSEPGLPITTVAQGAMSSIDEPLQVVVRSQFEWDSLWRRHGSAKAAPPVDFRTRMVLGVFLGSRPTAGYRVEIVEVVHEGATLVVRYAEKQPPADRMVAQVLTAPFHLVACDRWEGAVRFERKTP